MDICRNIKPQFPTALVRGDAHTVPLRDSSVDVVAMANVAEHFQHPVAVLGECRRVLKPGGRLVVMTVNQWFPPIALARCLPHTVRQFANRVTTGTRAEDTFPAYYRTNTLSSLRETARTVGLLELELRYIPHHPDYLMFSVTAYRAGILLERMLRPIRCLRHMILGVFQKTETDRPNQNSSAEIAN